MSGVRWFDAYVVLLRVGGLCREETEINASVGDVTEKVGVRREVVLLAVLKDK